MIHSGSRNLGKLIETPTTYRLFTEIFHVVVDGTSGRRFFEEIMARYNVDASASVGAASLPREETDVSSITGGRDASATHVPFADYVAAEQSSFDSPEYVEARDAAQKRFAGRSMSLPEGKAKSGCVNYFRSFKLHKVGVYSFTHFCRDLVIKPGWGMVYQAGTTAYGCKIITK